MRRLLLLMVAALFAAGCARDKQEVDDSSSLLKHNFISPKGPDTDMKELLDQRNRSGPMDGAGRLQSIKSQDGTPFERLGQTVGP